MSCSWRKTWDIDRRIPVIFPASAHILVWLRMEVFEMERDIDDLIYGNTTTVPSER